jgi:hypothetical protein
MRCTTIFYLNDFSASYDCVQGTAGAIIQLSFDSNNCNKIIDDDDDDDIDNENKMIIDSIEVSF